MVYLLHFSVPIAHAQHYIGFSTNQITFKQRLEHHRTGRGGRLPWAVICAGGTFIVSRIWEDGDRSLERRLKNSKKGRALCPLCAEEYATRQRAARSARAQRRKEKAHAQG